MPKPLPFKWRDLPPHLQFLCAAVAVVMILMIGVEWRLTPRSLDWPILIAGLPTSIAFATAMSRWIRKRQRAAEGLCPSCGYDLRATPEKCPECGHTPTADSPRP